jgi:hypothetical protein
MSRLKEILQRVFGYHRRTRHEQEKLGSPLSTAAVQVTFGLREIEEQEVSHDTVVDTNFPERNLLVSVGHFLQVAVVILQRIAIDLGGA